MPARRHELLRHQPLGTGRDSPFTASRVECPSGGHGGAEGRRPWRDARRVRRPAPGTSSHRSDVLSPRPVAMPAAASRRSGPMQSRGQGDWPRPRPGPKRSFPRGELSSTTRWPPPPTWCPGQEALPASPAGVRLFRSPARWRTTGRPRRHPRPPAGRGWGDAGLGQGVSPLAIFANELRRAGPVGFLTRPDATGAGRDVGTCDGRTGRQNPPDLLRHRDPFEARQQAQAPGYLLVQIPNDHACHERNIGHFGRYRQVISWLRPRPRGLAPSREPAGREPSTSPIKNRERRRSRGPGRPCRVRASATRRVCGPGWSGRRPGRGRRGACCRFEAQAY